MFSFSLQGPAGRAWKFSTNLGFNIQLTQDLRVASLIRKCPASICFPSAPITKGQTLLFQCSPSLEHGRVPHTFHTVVMTTIYNPNSVRNDYRYLFETCFPQNELHLKRNPFTGTICLEKDFLTGVVRIELKHNGLLECRNEEGQLAGLGTYAAEAVWIVFECYRVELNLLKIEEQDTWTFPSEDAKSGPRNEFAENRMPCDATLNACASSTDNDQTICKRLYDDCYTCSLSVTENNCTSCQHDVAHNSHVNECQRMDRIEKEMNIIVGQLKDIDPQNLHKNNVLQKSSAQSKNIPNIPTRLDNVERTMATVKQTLHALNCQTVETQTDSTLNFHRVAPQTDRVLDTRKHFVTLVSQLDEVHISDYLFEKDLISERQMKQVQDKHLPSEEARKLLLDIMRKMKLRYSQLRPILEVVRQEFLIELFFPPDNVLT